MTQSTTAVSVVEPQKTQIISGFQSADGFALMQRVASAFAASDLVPASFKGNIGNCIIGVELANRIGASPLMVMQNLNVIHGRPSWGSQFIISAINSCGMFSPLRFRMTAKGRKKIGGTEVDDIECIAYCTELATGEVLDGPSVSIEMAVREGWYTKNGSKWQTMPDLMLRYRAAAFFGRLYAPQILMGMATEDESRDIGTEQAPADSQVQVLNKGIAARATAAKKQKRDNAAPVIDATAAEVPPVDEASSAVPAAARDEMQSQTGTTAAPENSNILF